MSIHQRNHLNLFFSSYLSTESRSMLPNLSLIMEFLGNFFTNFIFEKLLSHEALLTGRVTATSNNQTQLYKWKLQMKKLFGRYRQLRILPKQILCLSYFSFQTIFIKWIWFVNSFKRFSDRKVWPPGQISEIRELLLNHYRKSVPNSMRLQNMCR